MLYNAPSHQHEFNIEDKDFGTVDLLLPTSHDERVTHYGLQGLATNVVPVTSESLTKKYPNIQNGMVAKIFLGEASCTSEPKILEKVEGIAKEHESAKGHIPELLWHHTFTNPMSAVREALGVSEPTTGSRVLYIPLLDVWRQCIFCHITLWKKGVHHRDVSPANLMWYEKDGKLIGVLYDYDLSSLVDEPGSQGNECTGTVPFMARDLLTEEGQRGEVKHMYRHVLESFIWCFAWISLRYKEGVLRPRGSRPFDEWATLDAVACGNSKLTLQTDKTVPACTYKDDPGWQFIRKCLFVLARRQFLRSEKAELTQESESESDMDEFLASLECTGGWAKLSN
ncbi:hypothetical protein CY34DRAFT_10517 [Suillus luteus UH-Slu-Lm8-n1]|uniref:Fungal-type protein kinase domain-containing protein n=1 Tax=Suillus luteus UH-Slu-Lm8-n1 TaxID=930992 RepID=A0A0D0B5S0_9AGAM|nr:hypothetical protein CY34DRAFT_10517 [Suillus luteus UH-Slu-Lm8-n1]